MGLLALAWALIATAPDQTTSDGVCKDLSGFDALYAFIVGSAVVGGAAWGTASLQRDSGYARLLGYAAVAFIVPYVIAQGYAAMATLAVALALPSRYTRGSDIYWAWACFVIAKMCEAFDRPIYRAIEVVSGHTLKHLAAAAAGLVICAMLARRVVRTEDAAP